MKRICTFLLFVMFFGSTIFAISTTWNGSIWSAGDPTANDDATIDDVYNTLTNGAITAKNLTISESGSLTAETNAVSVTNSITNNGFLQINSDATLSALVLNITSGGLISIDGTVSVTTLVNSGTVSINSGALLTTSGGMNTFGTVNNSGTLSVAGTLTLWGIIMNTGTLNIGILSITSGTTVTLSTP